MSNVIWLQSELFTEEQECRDLSSIYKESSALDTLCEVGKVESFSGLFDNSVMAAEFDLEMDANFLEVKRVISVVELLIKLIPTSPILDKIKLNEELAYVLSKSKGYEQGGERVRLVVMP